MDIRLRKGTGKGPATDIIITELFAQLIGQPPFLQRHQVDTVYQTLQFLLPLRPGLFMTVPVKQGDPFRIKTISLRCSIRVTIRQL